MLDESMKQKMKKYFIENIKQQPQHFKELEFQSIMILQLMIDGLEYICSNKIWQDKQEFQDSIEPIRKDIVDYVYSNYNSKDKENCGFHGSLLRSSGHIVHTQCGLDILLKLKDSLEKVDELQILQSLGQLQNPDGSLRCRHDSQESDIRFIYSMTRIVDSIQNIIRIKKGDQLEYMEIIGKYVDIGKVLDYLQKCQNYDGGFGLKPGLESHSGAIFCGLNSLRQLDRMDLIRNKEGLLYWLVNRQNVKGVNGRIDKLSDTCYGYWVLGGLSSLECQWLVDRSVIEQFIVDNHDNLNGGIKKNQQCGISDPVHSSLAILSLSFIE